MSSSQGKTRSLGNHRQSTKDDDSSQESSAGVGGGQRQEPAATISLGRLRCVIWGNEADNGDTWYSCTMTRTYKGEKGEPKQATTLGRDDLLVGAELLRLAYHRIAELEATR